MVEIITEIECIQRYLEKNGSKVIDVTYYNEQKSALSSVGSPIVCNLGGIDGYDYRDIFFFGNVNIVGEITNAVTLADKNMAYIDFETRLKGRNEVSVMRKFLGIGQGMNLCGNGEYVGNYRMYGMGCNYPQVYFVGANQYFYVGLSFNGYLFKMK